jgi:hypothetical protein
LFFPAASKNDRRLLIIQGGTSIMLKSIAVMTSGGDSPGMNAAARAVVRTALYEGVKVWGIRDGYHGLLEENMFEMQSKDVGDIIQRGGTFLGTARCKRWKTPEGRMLGYQHLVDRGIQGLCVIGGDGSLRGAPCCLRKPVFLSWACRAQSTTMFGVLTIPSVAIRLPTPSSMP